MSSEPGLTGVGEWVRSGNVAVHLGQIELALLFLLMLCLVLLDTPIPRVLALPAAALVTAQTAALHHMHERAVTFADEPASEGLTGVADIVAVIVVPALGVVLFGAVFLHLARANARIRAAAARACPTPSAATSPPAAAPPRERRAA
jgi:hypothetical protein